MIKGIFTSVSGLQYLQLKQEITANNLANIATTGFKKDGVFRKALVDRSKILQMNATDFVNLEEVDQVRTDHSQGSFNITNNTFDFAIDGSGFFTVDTPSGILYTRNGSFMLDSENYIVTTHGYRLLNQDNLPIQVSEGEIFIDIEGAVTVDGQTIANLKIMDFQKPYNLLKMGDGLFNDHTNSGFLPGLESFRIRQGMLEDSNVNAVEEMVKLISAVRDFETNQRSILSQDETLDKVINEVGKVRG